MTRAFLFPGQGSQAVGMGKDLAEAFPVARQTFQEIDEALKQNLSRLMAEGPESDLMLTENAQPAIMAASLAVARVLESEGGFSLAQKARFAAGHSLGEYSALAAMGTFSATDAARLLKLRGQAMQKAVPVGQGAMAALLGLDYDAVAALAQAAAQGQVCQIANDNAPGQVVISGHKAAVERALAITKLKTPEDQAAADDAARAVLAKHPSIAGIRAVSLPVSAPFHCALMQPAADAMAEALDRVTLNAPRLPIMANVTAAPESDPARIKALLVEQVTGRVRWRESVQNLAAQGVTELIELGHGNVLTGLAKRIDKSLAAQAVGKPADIEALLKTLA